MKEENLNDLHKQLKFIGLGHIDPTELAKAFEGDKKKVDYAISVPYKANGEKYDVKHTLHFAKGDSRYFLNGFTVEHNNNAGYFYVNKDEKNITSKQAFNLMEGRAVKRELTNKEGGKYGAWIQIDPQSQFPKLTFQMYPDRLGYDLHSSLKRLNANGLYFPTSMENIIKALEVGNDVEAFNADKSKTYFVSANPKDFDVNIYAGREKISLDQLKEDSTPKESTSIHR